MVWLSAAPSWSFKAIAKVAIQIHLEILRWILTGKIASLGCGFSFKNLLCPRAKLIGQSK